MGKNKVTPFGKEVMKALESMGMKQVELAKKVGCDKQYLYMILHGQRSGQKYLSMIAEVCNIDLTSYVNDTKKAGKPRRKSKKAGDETKEIKKGESGKKATTGSQRAKKRTGSQNL